MQQFQDDSLDGYTCPHVSSRKMLMILFIRECVATTLLRLRMLAESKHYYNSELLEPKTKKQKQKEQKQKQTTLTICCIYSGRDFIIIVTYHYY